MQFAVHIYDAPVTLKQSQGRQTYHEKTPTLKVFVFFFKKGNASISSLERVENNNNKKVVYS